MPAFSIQSGFDWRVKNGDHKKVNETQREAVIGETVFQAMIAIDDPNSLSQRRRCPFKWCYDVIIVYL